MTQVIVILALLHSPITSHQRAKINNLFDFINIYSTRKRELLILSVCEKEI